jgi:hypothetical protein
VAAFDRREQHGSLGSRGHGHSEQVVGQRFEGGNIVWRESIGAAPSSPVRENQPSVCRQPPQEPREVGTPPREVDVRGPALEVEEIDGSLAEDLVGEGDVTVPRIEGFRWIHVCIVHLPAGALQPPSGAPVLI